MRIWLQKASWSPLAINKWKQDGSGHVIFTNQSTNQSPSFNQSNNHSSAPAAKVGFLDEPCFGLHSFFTVDYCSLVCMK